QHWSTDLTHHSADFFDARIGLPSTTTNTGLVCDDGKTRSATQLDFWIGTSNETPSMLPSAVTSVLATGRPLTRTSTGILRVSPIRARSRSQYGFWSSGRDRIARASAVGFVSRCAATCAVTFTVPGLESFSSLPDSPGATLSTRKSIRWLLPSVT